MQPSCTTLRLSARHILLVSCVPPMFWMAFELEYCIATITNCMWSDRISEWIYRTSDDAIEDEMELNVTKTLAISYGGAAQCQLAFASKISSDRAEDAKRLAFAAAQKAVEADASVVDIPHIAEALAMNI